MLPYPEPVIVDEDLDLSPFFARSKPFTPSNCFLWTESSGLDVRGVHDDSAFAPEYVVFHVSIDAWT